MSAVSRIRSLRLSLMGESGIRSGRISFPLTTFLRFILYIDFGKLNRNTAVSAS
jgi:hypothetical protein